jgi:hypothetical protein
MQRAATDYAVVATTVKKKTQRQKWFAQEWPS